MGHEVRQRRPVVSVTTTVLFSSFHACWSSASARPFGGALSLKSCVCLIAATALLLSGVACAEVQSMAGQCWSRGESFNQVVDDHGNVHRVEPAKLPRSLGGEDIHLCGISRTGAKPVALPEKYSLLGMMSRGFLLPSGDPIYATDIDNSRWILTPAQWKWFYE